MGKYRRRLYIINIIILIWGLAGCAKPMLDGWIQKPKKWVCNKKADYEFKRENYRTSILLHEKLLVKEPFNALAMYHLGYAYGKIGNHQKEVFYYKKSIQAGFHEDNIFFNLPNYI